MRACAFLLRQDGYSALHLAVRFRSLAALTALLERGARADLRDRDDRTPFHYAADLDEVHCLRALLRCPDGKLGMDARDKARFFCEATRLF